MINGSNFCPFPEISKQTGQIATDHPSARPSFLPISHQPNTSTAPASSLQTQSDRPTDRERVRVSLPTDWTKVELARTTIVSLARKRRRSKGVQERETGAADAMKRRLPFSGSVDGDHDGSERRSSCRFENSCHTSGATPSTSI